MQVELPSDVAAGYVFGGVWLGLNILLLETLRLLKNIDTETIDIIVLFFRSLHFYE